VRAENNQNPRACSGSINNDILEGIVADIEESDYPINRESLLGLLRNVHNANFRVDDLNNETWDRLADEGLAELIDDPQRAEKWVRTGLGSAVHGYLERRIG
jgi:hypothetical protein